MLCEVCQSEDAVVTLIPVAEGMPQSIGSGCFARFGLESAKAVLPAEEIAGILGPMFVAPARAEALAKTPKRRRPGRTALDAAIEAGQQVDDGDEGELAATPAEESEPGPAPTAPPVEESSAAQDA